MFYGRTMDGWRCSSKSLANLFRKSISLFFNSFKYIFRDSVAHWRSYFILKLKINLDTLTARLETPLRHKQRERNRTKTILDKKELRISPAVFWNSFEAVARCFGANVKLIKLILSGKIFLSLSLHFCHIPPSNSLRIIYVAAEEKGINNKP